MARGLYTADQRAPAEDLVARNRWSIVAHYVPDALIADRSAAMGGRVVFRLLTIVSATRASELVLPGLTVSPRAGRGPLTDDLPWPEGLHLTSDARTLVDNLAVSRGRGRVARTLSRAELDDWLVRKTQQRPEGWLTNLRARAIEVCDELGAEDRRAAVEELIGAAAGTRPVRRGSGRLLAARSTGREFDPDRIARFDELAGYLGATTPTVEVPLRLPAQPGEEATSLPFFEAYFSNFIEGTEFTLEEAEDIVETGAIPPQRPADAHDILGTYDAVTDPEVRSVVGSTTEEFFELLERRHRMVMEGRPDKRPGQFKQQRNQAGSYVFVAPPLVEGTLTEGFRRLVDLPVGLPRALFALFVISEVHPYDDGNGRVARAVMNAELTADGQARLLVPIVFRNEYLTALRGLSRDGRRDLYVRTLAYAWRWTAAMPWEDRPAVDGMLVATHALVDSTDAERTGVRLELP